MKIKDMLNMNTGDSISKSEMKKIITESKIINSSIYMGEEYIINDTYQKGINWIGAENNPLAVIIKSRPGKYAEDANCMNYALQSRKKRNSNEVEINKDSKANRVVINTKNKKYPLLYFKDEGKDWVFIGKYFVSHVNEKNVDLEPFYDSSNIKTNIPITEGDIKIIQHAIYERNLNLVEKIKKDRNWICDICNIDINEKYDVRFIEAHHKIMISDYKKKHEVKEEDIVLICPNCHTAVHILMKKKMQYDEIKRNIKKLLMKNV